MSGFLSELGRKLADQWLTLLVLPGLLWVAAVVAAAVLGQRAALDVGVLQTWLERTADVPSGARTAVLVADVAAVLAAAAGGGVVAVWLGRAVERLWTTPGRRFPGPWLTGRRAARWARAYADVRAEIATAAAQVTDTGAAGVPRVRRPAVADALARCARICLVPPARPTWIGDRLRAAEVRIHRTVELDMSVAWPRLWLVLPDGARGQFTSAYQGYLSAARLVAWGVLYLVVGVWWWPALLVAAGAGVTGWVQARQSTEVLAALTESTVDLYGADLARQVGVECDGPLTSDVGRELTVRLRKDDTLFLSAESDR